MSQKAAVAPGNHNLSRLRLTPSSQATPPPPVFCGHHSPKIQEIGSLGTTLRPNAHIRGPFDFLCGLPPQVAPRINNAGSLPFPNWHHEPSLGISTGQRPRETNPRAVGYLDATQDRRGLRRVSRSLS